MQNQSYQQKQLDRIIYKSWLVLKESVLILYSYNDLYCM